MKGYIYKSEIANKVYIGKTISKLESRIKSHINHAFKQNYTTEIAKALRLIGEENAFDTFSLVEVIEEPDYESLEKHLCERENYWMQVYDSVYPNGYNIYKSSPQKKRNVKSQPPRKSVMRPVFCLETGELFSSMTEAAKHANVDISSIYHCLKGINNTAGKKHWRYADGEYNKCKRPEGGKNKLSQSKPVICKETGVIYPSAGEAQRQTGIGRTHILKCATGKAITAGGLKWGLVIDGIPVYEERKNYNVKKIMCIDTREIFDSIAECSRKLGENNSGSLQSSIKRGCKHKGKMYVQIDNNGNPVLSSHNVKKCND